MKLQTMLLPTGEFMLVLDQNSRPIDDNVQEILQSLKRETGAAAVFMVPESIEVVDAMVDENAVRRPEPDQFETWLNYEHEREEIAKDFNDIVRAPITPSTLAIDELNAWARDNGERELTPAGLVKGRPGDPDFLRDPSFTTGGEPGADPEPEGVVSDPIEEPTYEPKPGDCVRIKAVNGWEGRQGTVVGEAGPEGRGVWIIQLVEGQVWSSDVELIEPAPEPERKPREGDWIRVLGTLFVDHEQHVGTIRQVDDYDPADGTTLFKVSPNSYWATEWELVDGPEAV